MEELYGMKALTVLQPWAWAIIDGRKRVENRSWRTKFRGPLLIHAGKSRSRIDPSLVLPDGELHPPVAELAFGAILGIVQVIDCVPVTEIAGDAFASGPWCWVLEGAKGLAEPVYCPGAQLLWTYRG